MFFGATAQLVLPRDLGGTHGWATEKIADRAVDLCGAIVRRLDSDPFSLHVDKFRTSNFFGVRGTRCISKRLNRQQIGVPPPIERRPNKHCARDRNGFRLLADCW